MFPFSMLRSEGQGFKFKILVQRLPWQWGVLSVQPQSLAVRPDYLKAEEKLQNRWEAKLVFSFALSKKNGMTKVYNVNSDQ